MPSQASRTAVLVCQARAVADGRIGSGQFADPIAARLLRPSELLPVTQIRDGVKPASWQERMALETIRACAVTMVSRTIAIDAAIEQAAHPQVVIVGAGLDARPWRLAALRDAHVFAVDHPASQNDARARTAGLAPAARQITWVAADLADADLAAVLADAGHDAAKPTTWVCEGIVPYLHAPDVERTVAAIARRSASGSAVVINYQAPSPGIGIGRRIARTLMRRTSVGNAMAGEPWRSLWRPTQLADLLTRHGLDVERDDDLQAISDSAELGLRGWSLRTGRVCVACKA